jgi:hypothetical protein
MLRSEHRLDHKAEVNCGPLSLVMIPGTPNLWIQPWRSAAALSAAVMDVSGYASGQRVVLSTSVNKYE